MDAKEGSPVVGSASLEKLPYSHLFCSFSLLCSFFFSFIIEIYDDIITIIFIACLDCFLMARRRRHTKKVVAYENDDVATLHGLLHSRMFKVSWNYRQTTAHTDYKRKSIRIVILCAHCVQIWEISALKSEKRRIIKFQIKFKSP